MNHNLKLDGVVKWTCFLNVKRPGIAVFRGNSGWIVLALMTAAVLLDGAPHFVSTLEITKQSKVKRKANLDACVS